MIYALIAWLAGYDGYFIPSGVGESYIEHNVPYMPLRTTSALLSTLTVPAVYLILQESACSVPACLTAASLLALDNAHISMTRMFYLDSILGLSTACSLLFFIKFLKQHKKPMSTSWYMWLLLTGAALSFTISTKYTGAFTFVTVGFGVILDLWKLYDIRNPRAVNIPNFFAHVAARAFALIVVPFVLYLLWFWINLLVLTVAGAGNDFMSVEFQQTLRYKHNIWKRTTLPFHQKYLELQDVMLDSILTRAPIHPYESRPYHWPVALSAVSFWCSDEDRQQILQLANVVGWWIASSCVALVAVSMVSIPLLEARGLVLVSCSKSLHHYLYSVLIRILQRRVLFSTILPAFSRLHGRCTTFHSLQWDAS